MKQIIDIMTHTEAYYGLSPGSLVDQCRTSTVAKARHVAAYLSRTRTKHSFPEISNIFHRHHTSIMSSVDRVKNNYKEFEQDINNILPSRIIL